MILICIGLVILQVWLELTMPDYTKKLTEAVSAGKADMDIVIENGGKMMLCALGSMAAAFVCGLLAAVVAGNFAKTLREKLFAKVSSFSEREMNYFTTPSLITRTTNDVVQQQTLIAMGLMMLIKAPITAIWAISKISNSSREWTTAVFISVVIILSAIGILVGLSIPKFKIIQKLTDDLNDVTRENLTGVRVVRAFNAEQYQQDKFDEVNRKITKNHLFTSRVMGLMMPIMTTAMSGLTLAIYWIGAYLINEAPLTGKAVKMGEMMAFSQYALQVVISFMMLVMIFVILPRTLVSAKRINEVLETEPSISFRKNELNDNSHSVFVSSDSTKKSSGTEKAADKTKDSKTENLSDRAYDKNHGGSVEFKNVSFSYNSGSADYCLKNLNFKIGAGETFAIIGATGSGKTSLINLLPRYYDVSQGEVLIDGKNIKDFSEEDLESRLSIAPQKAVLFSGNIGKNVGYGSGEKTDSEEFKNKANLALDIANADFALDGNGLEKDVSQGGSNFSGGQKQRLSIARAVFKDAEIYIFDDTFSALDYKTDMLVRKKIRENMQGKTVIIVAQRIGTIKNADKILVLHEGEVAGLGTHEELLSNCAIYKEIALSQLSEEELKGAV